MNWSRVKNPKEKPLKWWWYKILCEIGWNIQYKILNKGQGMYYKHLHKLCALGWTLYGEKI